MSTVTSTPRLLFRYSDDAVAIATAFFVVLVSLVVVFLAQPADKASLKREYAEQQHSLASSKSPDEEAIKAAQGRLRAIENAFSPQPWKTFWLKASDWRDNPLKALQNKVGNWQWSSFLITGGVLLGLVLIGGWWQSKPIGSLIIGFIFLYLLTTLAFVLASQEVLKYSNLEYPLWALLVGLLIANTWGVPGLLQAAVMSDRYVKIGLVLLGAEVLFGKLLELGLPGVLVSWTVTPIVLVLTYWFGQRILRIESRELNMVISADMSVCGVSAAIATAAACRAKKEELSLAIALSLVFTVVMMVVMPYGIRWMGLNDVLAGAWLGGTIDSTGAVAAASELLRSPIATEVATTIKMIQNVLIGVFAVAIAAYWSTLSNASSDDQRGANQARYPLREVWDRFPKFAIGFLAMSLVCSAIQASSMEGNGVITGVVDGTTKHLRAWFFCLAFVCIGLESDLRQFGKLLRSGKPIVLYLVGQAINLTLSFLACYIVFEWLFRATTEKLLK